MSNVMNGVLGFAGDKPALRLSAMADVAQAIVSGWCHGDVSILLETAKACGASRAAKAVEETLIGFADEIRTARKGGAIVLGDGASAARRACVLGAVPANPLELSGKPLELHLAAWGRDCAEQWGKAVDAGIATAKAVADAKKKAKADSLAAVSVAVDATAEKEQSSVAVGADGAAMVGPSVAELLTQVESLSLESVRLAKLADSLTQENVALLAMLAAVREAQDAAVTMAVESALSAAQANRENAAKALMVKPAAKAKAKAVELA